MIAVGTKKVFQNTDYRFYTNLTNTEVSHPQSQGTHVEHTSGYVQSMDQKELLRNSRYWLLEVLRRSFKMQITGFIPFWAIQRYHTWNIKAHMWNTLQDMYKVWIKKNYKQIHGIGCWRYKIMLRRSYRILITVFTFHFKFCWSDMDSPQKSGLNKSWTISLREDYVILISATIIDLAIHITWPDKNIWFFSLDFDSHWKINPDTGWTISFGD